MECTIATDVDGLSQNHILVLNTEELTKGFVEQLRATKSFTQKTKITIWPFQMMTTPLMTMNITPQVSNHIITYSVGFKLWGRVFFFVCLCDFCVH